MNSLKSFVTGFFLWGILGGISAQNKVLSFSMPDESGTLRLGIIENNSSRWLDEKQTQLHIDCQPLSNTKGFILEIENKREDITLGWAFGMRRNRSRIRYSTSILQRQRFQCRRYTGYNLPRESHAIKSDQSHCSFSFFHSFI